LVRLGAGGETALITAPREEVRGRWAFAKKKRDRNAGGRLKKKKGKRRGNLSGIPRRGGVEKEE